MTAFIDYVTIEATITDDTVHCIEVDDFQFVFCPDKAQIVINLSEEQVRAVRTWPKKHPVPR